MKTYPNCRPGECYVGSLCPGARFRLDFDRGQYLTGTVKSHSGGQTTVRYDVQDKISAVFGEEIQVRPGDVGISTRTAVVPL